MGLLSFFERTSFKTIIAWTFLIALVFSIPVVVWTAQQETKTEIGAYFAKPDLDILKQTYGPASPGQPQITLVWPFLGKVNDAVLIYGNNFGRRHPDPSDYLESVHQCIPSHE